jgi:hypothetical protein
MPKKSRRKKLEVEDPCFLAMQGVSGAPYFRGHAEQTLNTVRICAERVNKCAQNRGDIASSPNQEQPVCALKFTAQTVDLRAPTVWQRGKMATALPVAVPGLERGPDGSMRADELVQKNRSPPSWRLVAQSGIVPRASCARSEASQPRGQS